MEIQEKKIAHRDLKPENIIFIPDEEKSIYNSVKIADFGIRKELLAFKGTAQSKK